MGWRLKAGIVGFTAALSAAILLAPAAARACSPNNDVTVAGPDPAGPIPANAAIRLHGGPSLASETIVVTVDDAPGVLVELPELQRSGYAWDERGYVVEGLQEGQHVVLSWCYGDACSTLIEYDAVAPQLEPPSPPVSVLFDLHDYPEILGFGPACQFSEELRWWLKVETAEPTTDLELLYVFEGVDPADHETLRFREYYEVDGSTLAAGIARTEVVLDGADATTGMCIRAYALDSAGQRSEAIETCLPCRYRSGEADLDEWGLPLEPMWTQADIYDDGPCAAGVPEPWDPGPPADPDPGGESTGGDTGSDETGELPPPSDSSGGDDGPGTTGGSGSGSAGSDDPLDRGCACRADGREHGAPIEAALGLLVLLGLRRRRR